MITVKKPNNNIMRLALGLVISFVYVLAVYYRAGICFETNDDRFLSEILSGVLSTGPDAHAVFLNYWLALPLSALYRLTIAFPWYGGALILFHLLSYGLMLDGAYSRCEKWVQYLFVTACGVALVLAGISSLSQIQFTSTAALLAIAGYVCLLLNRSGKKGFLLFIVLEFLGYCVRQDSMLMIQPFGLSVCLGLLLGRQGRIAALSWKRRVQAFLLILAAILAVLLTAVVGNGIAYHNAKWKTYDRFNQIRAELYDIYGTPEYEEIRDILERYQVAEVQYEAFRRCTILDWDIPVECAEEIVAYAKERSAERPKLEKILQTLKNCYFHENYWKINRLTIVVWAVLLLVIVLHRHFIMLWPVLGVCIARVLIWGYLIWQGRYPHRVTHPLFLCEIALALSLLWLECGAKRKLWEIPVLLVCCFIICVVAYQSGKQQYYYVASENRGKLTFMEGMYEIQDYCREHPENRYIMESVSASYYTGSALDARLAQSRNSVTSGCWYSNSPSMRAKLREYLGGAEELYLIIYQDGSESGHPAVRYLEEACGSGAQRTDEITTSHGGTYTIYHFEIRQ